MTEPARERSASASQPLRAVAILVCPLALPAAASSTAPPRRTTFARPQSITWTSPKLTPPPPPPPPPHPPRPQNPPPICFGCFHVAVDHAPGVGVGDGLADR